MVVKVPAVFVLTLKPVRSLLLTAPRRTVKTSMISSIWARVAQGAHGVARVQPIEPSPFAKSIKIRLHTAREVLEAGQGDAPGTRRTRCPRAPKTWPRIRCRKARAFSLLSKVNFAATPDDMKVGHDG